MSRPILTGVNVVLGQRIVSATVEGLSYEIPELWMVGYCQSHADADAFDAIRAWHELNMGIPDAPPHDCEFKTNPEKGACDFHERWAGDFALRVDDE
jgi:hypothetical protein